MIKVDLRRPPGDGAARPAPPPGDEVLRGWYAELHARAEVSGQERRTAAWAAQVLARLGMSVRVGVGGHGVVAQLTQGIGPTVVLRAELDALPVDGGPPWPTTPLAGEELGGPARRAAHTCGHDVHMSAVLGAAAALVSSRQSWQGTVAVVLQPAEETGTGARAMLEDGLAGLLPPVDQLLALHTSALPTGAVTFRPGVMTRAGMDVEVVFEGEGGHAAFAAAHGGALGVAASWVHELRSAPPTGVDVSVGSLRSGTCANVVAERAVVLASVRADRLEGCREHVLQLRRRVHGLTGPDGLRAGFRVRGQFEPAVNGPAAGASVFHALREAGEQVYLLPGPSRACDDVGTLAQGLGAELGYWFVGANDPARFDQEDLARVMRGEQPLRVAGNHSARFSPDLRVLPVATRQLLVAARRALAPR